jgi:exonuclease SbcC
MQLVFETLKSLQKENRIVGIISHVEELQMEIDTYLEIEQHPEYGSTISRSWERE